MNLLGLEIDFCFCKYVKAKTYVLAKLQIPAEAPPTQAFKFQNLDS